MGGTDVAASVVDHAGSLCRASVTSAPMPKDEAIELARVLGALADPVRLRLLSLVASCDEICSCDLENPARQKPTNRFRPHQIVSRSRSDRRGEAGPMDVVASRTGSPRRDPSSARRLTGPPGILTFGPERWCCEPCPRLN